MITLLNLGDRFQHVSNRLLRVAGKLMFIWNSARTGYGQNACMTFTLACAPTHGARCDHSRRGTL
jgi:hypothetical protein